MSSSTFDLKHLKCMQAVIGLRNQSPLAFFMALTGRPVKGPKDLDENDLAAFTFG